MFISLYMILLVLTQTLINGRDIFSEHNDGFGEISKKYKRYWIKNALSLGRWILYFGLYYLSLMHSVDVYVMICRAFDYESFRKRRNIMRMLIVGGVFCVLMCIEDPVRMSYEYRFLSFDIDHDLYFYEKLMHGIWCFSIAKLCLLKTVYAVIVAKIGSAIKLELDSSLEIMSNAKRASIYQSLKSFVYIPSLINVILLSHDIPYFASSYFYLRGYCEPANYFYQDKGTLHNISAFGFALASFSHVLGYLFLFPKFRNALVCW